MAPAPNDPNTGFSTATRTFHSLRLIPLLLPNPDQHMSAANFALQVRFRRQSRRCSTTAIIDSTTGLHVFFQDFLNQVSSLAASLSWLAKGSVAFVLAPNSTQVPVLYFALLSLGVVVSPANPLGTPADISRQVNLSSPNVVFATDDTASKLPSDQLSIPVIFLHTQHFNEMMLAGDSSHWELRRTVVQSDPAAILYSSGTTGSVKGVVLTHRNLIASIVGYYAMWGDDDRPSPHVNLLPIPLFHVLGFTMWLSSVALGDALVLMKRFNVGGALKAVENFKVTMMTAPPPVIAAMAKHVSAHDLSSLEELTTGGAALSDKLAAAFATKFPWVKLHPGYGMTEAGPVAQTRGLKPSYHAGSVGHLCPQLEAKIVDTNSGEALSPGQTGELWIRGPTIMHGYVGDKAATSEVLDSEGWFKTGDACFFDENGRIHIVDRLKEMIKYKGYQVAPAELEKMLLSHPEIADAAVIPYPDEEAGEVPMAFVVKVSGSDLNELQIINFAAKHVAPYKKIRRVAIVEAIPKNPTGKILRKELTKIALANIASKL